MAEKHDLIEQHSFVSETIFFVKSSLLICARALKNIFYTNVRKFRTNHVLKGYEIIAFSETDLWSTDDNEQNWILTAGKVQNLRIAASKLNGVEIPANTTFSFWKQIGNPSRLRGYVIGREIRQGCLVPTIAGGLCQLSNALYDAALKAGFEIIERHKHTRVIKGSLAEIDRDATVKWNYIDLRFKAKSSFRIEVELTSDKLILAFKSTTKLQQEETNRTKINQVTKLNDCYSCGNSECFKYPGKVAQQNRLAATTFLLDEKWPEHEGYITSIAKSADYFLTPFTTHSRIKIGRLSWTPANRNKCTTVSLLALYRSLAIRVAAKFDTNIFALMLNLDRRMAVNLAKRIPIESTHIVIAQNLLPFVWQTGVLGGRTFDVLMTRLPLETLHARLDNALRKYSDSPTLGDFRAPQTLVEAESTALTKARHIITPHQEIADLFNNKSMLLEWKRPGTRPVTTGGTKILFPASALGRKGAYEVRQLAKELGLVVVVMGDATEHKLFWQGVNIERPGSNVFDEIQLVVYPTYVEQQPRFLLKAIAAGLTVITTKASGLKAMENVVVIPVGDYDALKQAVTEKLFANSLNRTYAVV